MNCLPNRKLCLSMQFSLGEAFIASALMKYHCHEAELFHLHSKTRVFYG